MRRVLEGLEEKSESVRWFNEDRQEYFGIIAKKIGKVEKEKLRSEGYLVFDLEDVNDVLTKAPREI